MESFFQNVTNVFVSNSQHSLRDRKGSLTILSIFQKFTHTHLKNNKKAEKRALSDCFSVQSLHASMTVEATIVLPIFLFSVMNVIFSFRMIETQSRVLAAVHQTGNKLCFWGYANQFIPDRISSQALSFAVSESYVRASVTDAVGVSFLEHSSVTGGAMGLSFLGSSLMETNDIVDIQIRWWTRPFIGNYGLLGFATGVRYYGRAWTGYDNEVSGGGENLSDRMVYITEHGTVYHASRNCYHLTPTIHCISVGQVDSKRNQSGQRYRACMYCGNHNSMQAVCYITPEGERYHTDPNCSGLKRTIYTVPLSSVQDKSACMNCY